LSTFRLVLWFIILLALVPLLGILFKRWGVESPLDVVALDLRVLGAWVPWALRGALNSRGEVIWLPLSGGSRVVPLAFVIAVIVPPLVVVIVVVAALREAIAL
jgi:hypothetical protein